MTDLNNNKVFDYRALRLLIGIIAFAIPICVSLISSVPLPSISASYCSEARDIFVGMLFIVAAFLWAYNGHSKLQSTFSKIASPAAILVAVFPTACEEGISGISSTVHYVSAPILIIILAYFCLGPFRQNIKGLGGKKGRRAVLL